LFADFRSVVFHERPAPHKSGLRKNQTDGPLDGDRDVARAPALSDISSDAEWLQRFASAR
jgi:hypothetical protein